MLLPPVMFAIPRSEPRPPGGGDHAAVFLNDTRTAPMDALVHCDVNVDTPAGAHHHDVRVEQTDGQLAWAPWGWVAVK